MNTARAGDNFSRAAAFHFTSSHLGDDRRMLDISGRLAELRAGISDLMVRL